MPRARRTPTRRLESFDGTRLAIHERGDSGGQPVLLCNGLGGGYAVWQPIIERLGPAYHFVGFDYRGLDASGPAPTREAYRIRDHARDAACIVEELGLKRPILIGWSMGAQVILELHRTHAELPAAAVALFGTAGLPLDTAFDSGWSRPVLSPVFRAMQSFGGRVQALEWLAQHRTVADTLAGALQRTGLMARHADLDVFHELVRGFGQMDLAVYARIFEELGLHDASDLADEIDTPFLVIAGAADRMTPPTAAQALARRLQRGREVHLDGATHFGPLEERDAIADAIREFLNDAMFAS